MPIQREKRMHVSLVDTNLCVVCFVEDDKLFNSFTMLSKRARLVSVFFKQ